LIFQLQLLCLQQVRQADNVRRFFQGIKSHAHVLLLQTNLINGCQRLGTFLRKRYEKCTSRKTDCTPGPCLWCWCSGCITRSTLRQGEFADWDHKQKAHEECI